MRAYLRQHKTIDTSFIRAHVTYEHGLRIFAFRLLCYRFMLNAFFTGSSLVRRHSLDCQGPTRRPRCVLVNIYTLPQTFLSHSTLFYHFKNLTTNIFIPKSRENSFVMIHTTIYIGRKHILTCNTKNAFINVWDTFQNWKI